jgi:predicted DNA-binding transcriptional regulator AlpA
MNNSDSTLQALLNEHEVAQVLNVSVQTIRKRRRLHMPPAPVKIGTSVRYTIQSVQSVIDKGYRHTQGDAQ